MMEKLHTDIAVLNQSKMYLKKEYDALTIDHRRVNNDFKAHKENYANLFDENTKILT